MMYIHDSVRPRIAMQTEIQGADQPSVPGASQITMHVEFSIDYGAMPPDVWHGLPAFLEAAGFIVERSVSGDCVILVPTSFFSSTAYIAASKSYSDPQSPVLSADLFMLNEMQREDFSSAAADDAMRRRNAACATPCRQKRWRIA